MPAPLDVDWKGIAVLAASGETLENISKQTGISLNTLKARSVREGWKSTRANIAGSKAVELVNQGIQPRATSGLQIVEDIMASRQKKTKLALSKYVREAAHAAATSGGNLKIAQDVKHVASIMQALDPNQGKDPGMTLAFYSVGGDMTVENKTVIVEQPQE